LACADELSAVCSWRGKSLRAALEVTWFSWIRYMFGLCTKLRLLLSVQGRSARYGGVTFPAIIMAALILRGTRFSACTLGPWMSLSRVYVWEKKASSFYESHPPFWAHADIPDCFNVASHCMNVLDAGHCLPSWHKRHVFSPFFFLQRLSSRKHCIDPKLEASSAIITGNLKRSRSFGDRHAGTGTQPAFIHTTLRFLVII